MTIHEKLISPNIQSKYSLSLETFESTKSN